MMLSQAELDEIFADLRKGEPAQLPEPEPPHFFRRQSMWVRVSKADQDKRDLTVIKNATIMKVTGEWGVEAWARQHAICPKCGATPRDWCKAASGKWALRPHADRKDVATAMMTLDGIVVAQKKRKLKKIKGIKPTVEVKISHG